MYVFLLIPQVNIYMLKPKSLTTLLILGTLLIPYTTRPIPIDPQRVALEVLFRAVPEVLKWLNKEEHKCPVCPLERTQPCPLQLAKAYEITSKTIVSNYYKLASEDPEVRNMAIMVHLKMIAQLEQTAQQQEEDLEKLRLIKEHGYSVRDLKNLALLKARGYKDVPQELLWQAQRDEYVEVNPNIFVSKKFNTQHAQPQN